MDKRYYWIKLREEFMRSDAAYYLMEQPEGAQYMVMYLMLCIKSANTQGRLSLRLAGNEEPLSPSRLAREFGWFTERQVRDGLALLRKLGLISADENGILCVTEHSSLVGSESGESVKRRERRRARKADQPSVKGDEADNVRTLSGQMTTDTDKDIDIEKETDKDAEKNMPRGDARVCADAENEFLRGDEAHRADVAPLILRDGSVYRAGRTELDGYKAAYPLLDMGEQFRRMEAWLNENPSRRRDRAGIGRFISGWLSRANVCTQLEKEKSEACARKSRVLMNEREVREEEFGEGFYRRFD